MDLKGRNALITGAAHRVGQVIALQLASKGVNILIHYHQSAAEAEETVQQARELGVKAQALQADLRSTNAIQEMFASVDQISSHLDILVNSAAVMDRTDILNVSPEDWDRVMELNLKAAFFCLQTAAQRMQAGGAIVNISDIIGLRPWVGFPIHAISKAGIEMLTKAAALELAPTIRVNAVAPGPVLKPPGMSESRWLDIAVPSPLGVPGRPEDVARAVIFLLENDYITGETLVVDGGFQLV